MSTTTKTQERYERLLLSPYFNQYDLERVDELYHFIKDKDKRDKIEVLVRAGVIKSLKSYCIEKGYSPANSPHFTFFPQYQDWASGATIRGAYGVFVDEKLKDIMRDLKDIFK